MAVTKVALKLFGMYLLLQTITALPSLLASPDPRGASIGYYVIGIWGIAGLLLLFSTGPIAHHVLRIQSMDGDDASSAIRLLEVGVKLLGCYFALSAVYGLLYSWALTHVFNGSLSADFRPEEKSAMLAAGVQLLIGVLLWAFGGWFSRGLGAYDRWTDEVSKEGK